MSDFPQKPEGGPYDSPQADVSSDDGGPNNDERQMAMFAHLSGIMASLVTGTFAGFAGPMIIWIIKKDESAFIADQAKEALNFQLTLMIIVIACWGVLFLSCGLLFFMPLIPFVLQIIFGVIGGMKANEGVWYRYPFNIRMVT